MALKLQKLESVDDFVKIGYYGDGGTGKTTNLAHLCKLGPVIYVNKEGGLKKGPLVQHFNLPIEKIFLYEVQKYDDLETLFWELKDNPKYAKVVGVCVDSGTDTQQAIMEEILGQEVKKAERKGVERDPYLAYEGDWGKGNEKMRRMIRKFRDLPLHFGISALERRDVDTEDGEVKYGPALTPGAQSSMVGYMDIVCRTFVAEVAGEEQFRGRFRAVGKYIGKDRFKVLPKMLVDPTFDRVIAYVKGELTVATDEVMQKAIEENEKQKGSKEAVTIPLGTNTKTKGTAKNASTQKRTVKAG